MARRGQTDEVWDAVVAAWYPRGVPTRKDQRTKINGAVKDLREQGATGEEIALWVVNCRAAQQAPKDKDAWPKAGCTLHACVENWTTFAPGPEQILAHRFDKWQDGLPDEFRAYFIFNQDEARFCWLGAVGKSLSSDLKRAARKEWQRLDAVTKHRMSLKGEGVFLRDEVNRALAKYLPGGENDEDGN